MVRFIFVVKDLSLP